MALEPPSAEPDAPKQAEQPEGTALKPMLWDFATVIQADEARQPVVLTDGTTEIDERKASADAPAPFVQSTRESKFPIEVFATGVELDLQTAECRDKDRLSMTNSILRRDLRAEPIVPKHEKYVAINVKLRSILSLRAWRQAVEQGQTRDLQLTSAIGEEVKRSALAFDFNRCNNFDDMELKRVTSAFKPLINVKELRLDCDLCQALTSVADLALLGDLRSLRHLVLKFACCDNLTSAAGIGVGLGALPTLEHVELDLSYTGLESVVGLPKGFSFLKSLRVLVLNLKGCKKIQWAALPLREDPGHACLTGLDELAMGVAALKGLQHFSLNLGDCVTLGNMAVVAKVLAKLRSLNHFELNLSGTSLSTRCFAEVGQSLEGMKAMQRLSLAFSRTAVESVTEVGQSLAGMKSLEHLEVDLYRCSNLTSVVDIGRSLQQLSQGPKASPMRTFALNCRLTRLESATAIGQGISVLTSLQRLTLDFGFCGSIPNITEVGRALGRLELLEHLVLQLQQCRGVTSMTEIGVGLSKTQALQHFELNIEGCKGIKSLDEIGQSLATKKKLRHFELDASYCEGITSADELGRGLAQMEALDHLKLDFSRCRGLASVDELAMGIVTTPAPLRHLDLRLVRCYGLTEDQEFGDSLQALRALRHGRNHDFWECTGLLESDRFKQAFGNAEKLQDVLCMPPSPSAKGLFSPKSRSTRRGAGLTQATVYVRVSIAGPSAKGGCKQKLQVDIVRATGLRHIKSFTGDKTYCVCEVKHTDKHRPKPAKSLKGDVLKREVLRRYDGKVTYKELKGKTDDEILALVQSVEMQVIAGASVSGGRSPGTVVPVGTEMSRGSAKNAFVKHADKRPKPSKCQTKVLTKTVEPCWDESLVVDPWHDGEPLEFTIYDKGVLGNKVEGKAHLPSEYFDGSSGTNGFEGELPIEGDAALPKAVSFPSFWCAA